MPIRLDELINQSQPQALEVTPPSANPAASENLLLPESQAPLEKRGRRLDEIIRSETKPTQEPLTIKNMFKKKEGENLKGGLNVFQRMKLSFGDTKGRKQYLEDLGFKDVTLTPEGNFVMKRPDMDEWVVTDPTGFDLGDIGDLPGGALPLAGGTVGAIGGATAGTIIPGAGTTAGAVVGAGAGAAGGEGWRQAVGQLLGVYKGDTAQKVGQMATEGAAMAAGEGIGRAVIAPAIKGVQKMAQPAINAIKDKATQFTARMLNFTSKVGKPEIEYAIKNNPLKVLTKQNMEQNKPKQVAMLIHRGAKIADDAYGKRWADTVDPIRNNKKNIVDFSPVADDVRKIFRDFRIIDERGAFEPQLIGSKDRLKALKEIYTQFDDIEKNLIRKMSRTELLDALKATSTLEPMANKLMQRTGAKDFTNLVYTTPKETIINALGRNDIKKLSRLLPVDDAITIRQNIDSLVNKGFKEGIFNTKEVAILKGMRHSINRQIHGTYPQIADVDSAYASLHDAFNLIDIDWSNPKSVGSLENLLARYPSLAGAVKDGLKRVNNLMPENYKFIDPLRRITTAKAFEPTRPTDWLVPSIFSLVGTGVGLSGDPKAGAALTGAGLLLATPRGASAILRSGAKAAMAAGAVKKGIEKAAPVGYRGLIQKEIERERNKE